MEILNSKNLLTHRGNEMNFIRVLPLIIVLATSACADPRGTNALAGGALGAGVGGLLSGDLGGAAIGGALGAGAGALLTPAPRSYGYGRPYRYQEHRYSQQPHYYQYRRAPGYGPRPYYGY